MTEKKMDIESTLKQLEKIVTQMEEENLNLEDSLKSYEKGISLVNEAQKSINKIEKKIQILSGSNELNDLKNDA